MKAALCKSLDGPKSLVVETVPEPSAGPGQAIVRVKAVGLNFADTLITRGKYQWKPDLPFSPGAEIAGVVESISGEHPGLAPGQRVMAYVNWGGARQKIAVDAGALIPIPDAVPMTVAAGLSVTYGTAMHGLSDRGRLKSGETVVVTGAAGGAGQAAIEIAKLMGARVIAVASSPEKCAVAKAAGADETIEFPGTDLKAAVRALTGGNGADVVYDCIGGARLGAAGSGARVAGALSRRRLCGGRDSENSAQPSVAQGCRNGRRFLGRGGSARAGAAPRQHAASSRLGRSRTPQAAHPRHLSFGPDWRSAERS